MTYCHHLHLPILLSALLLLSLPATAQTFVDFQPVEGNPHVHGLFFKDGDLWGVHRASSNQRVIQIDPTSGNIENELALQDLGSITIVAGAWDGNEFWISRTSTSNAPIFRFNDDGELVGQIPTPSQLNFGIAWHNGDLWVSRAHPNDVAGLMHLDPETGDLLEYMPTPETQPAGMAFMGDGTVWVTNTGDDGTNVEVLQQFDLATGDLLQTLDMPDGAGRPKGLAYDGSQYMYMAAVVGGQHGIYTIDMGASGNPILTLPSPNLDFGLVTTDQTIDGTFTVSNTGDADLVLGDVEIEGDGFTTSWTGATVAPGGSVDFEISFSPDGYGPYEATLLFSTNDVSVPVAQVPLMGWGIFPEPTAGLAVNAHDFGSVRIDGPYDDGRSIRTWVLEVINQGLGDLTVNDITVSPPFSVEDEISFPVTLEVTDTLFVTLGFRPTSTGVFSEDGIVHSSDGTTPELAFALQGTGVNPDMEDGDILWTLTVPDNPNVSFQEKKVTIIRSLGDITGDGTADLVVGARNYLVFAVRGNSWETGEVLWTFNTCTDNFNCGAVNGIDGLFETGLATGFDIDGDGINDVVFGTGGGNDHVYAISGKDGSVIWEHGDVNDPYLASYYAVSWKYDFNGDGIPDVATVTGTASDNSSNPYNERRVYLLDGATGDILFNVQPSPLIPNFAVTQILTEDGTPLVVAGGRSDGAQSHITAYTVDGSVAWTSTPPNHTPFIMINIPREDGGEDVVYYGSGATGYVARIDGDSGEFIWGVNTSTLWSLDIIEHVRFEGSVDVIAGSLNGSVMFIDGDEGVVFQQSGSYQQVFGVATSTDVTDDGVPEVAFATGNGFAGLMDGATGDILWDQSFGNGTLDQAAEVVAIIPDIDGNGAPEIAVGTRHGIVTLMKSSADIFISGEPGGETESFVFNAPYPNPANHLVNLSFTLPGNAETRIIVFDMLGRRVATLVDDVLSGGSHTFEWNTGSNASGVYLIRLESGSQVETHRVTVVR